MAPKTRTVNVRADAYNLFRDAVHAKHGKLRGAVQEEASQALEAQARRISGCP